LENPHRSVLDLIGKSDFHLVNQADPLPPEGKFPLRLSWIPRERNELADRLGNEAFDRHMRLKKK